MTALDKFINQEVKHIKWNIGTIAAITEKYITIYFKHTDNGERYATFQYPKIFNDGFLSFVNDDLNNYFHKNVLNNVCYYCKQIDTNIKKISGLKICTNCQSLYLKKCHDCNNEIVKNKLKKIRYDSNVNNFYELCNHCVKNKTFSCDYCKQRFLKNNCKQYYYEGKYVCETCYSYNLSICYNCGILLKESNIKHIDLFYHGSFELCEQCYRKNTFQCSICKKINLLKYKSKINNNEDICKFCTDICYLCKAITLKTNLKQYRNKSYCNLCWDNNKKICDICKKEFVSQNNSEILCYDCLIIKEYVNRILKINFSNLPYKEMTYKSLEHIDRCKLFSDLYSSCVKDCLYYLENRNFEPYEYIIMKMFNKKIVITHLSEDITCNVKCSKNITLTEFRKSNVLLDVYYLTEKLEKFSTEKLKLPIGNMKILNNPILLRAQTKQIKNNYGKIWDGPDEYYTIHNYGDTENFYIIGVI